nr:MAG TPA_asm: PROTEIN/DNA Complex domain, DNA-binding domain, zinc-finger.74A [Caudoviricetes sp.]
MFAIRQVSSSMPDCVGGCCLSSCQPWRKAFAMHAIPED